MSRSRPTAYLNPEQANRGPHLVRLRFPATASGVEIVEPSTADVLRPGPSLTKKAKPNSGYQVAAPPASGVSAAPLWISCSGQMRRSLTLGVLRE
jgi:hypothetical protein